MTNSLLSTIVLVLPGIVAAYLIRLIGPVQGRSYSDLEKTVIGLLFNIPGILLTWTAITIGAHKELTFDEFQAIILSVPNFIYYELASFIIAFIVALLWEEKGKSKVLSWAQKKRKKGNRPILDDITPWERFLKDSDEAVVRIYPIDNKDASIWGQYQAGFVPGDTEKGVLLLNTDKWKAWDGWFKNPDRTYLDTTAKIVYELFSYETVQTTNMKINDYMNSLVTSTSSLVEEAVAPSE